MRCKYHTERLAVKVYRLAADAPIFRLLANRRISNPLTHQAQNDTNPENVVPSLDGVIGGLSAEDEELG
jgi:hypothetical protein